MSAQAAILITMLSSSLGPDIVGPDLYRFPCLITCFTTPTPPYRILPGAGVVYIDLVRAAPRTNTRIRFTRSHDFPPTERDLNT